MTVDDYLDTPEDFPYPTQIFEDRYGGSYSGAVWIAVVGWGDLQTSPTQAGDVPAAEFWDSDPLAERYGRGGSPDGALRDLVRRWESAGKPHYFDWSGVEI